MTTSNQRSPLWPYMLVLTGLFALTLALPRGWNNGDSSEPGLLSRHRASSKYSAPVAIVKATTDAAGNTAGPMPSDFTWSRGAVGEHRMPIDAQFAQSNPASGQQYSASAGIAETVARKIADLRQFGMNQFLAKAEGTLNGNSAGKNDPAYNAASATNFGDGQLPPELDLRQFETENNAGAANSAAASAGIRFDATAVERANRSGFISNFCPIPRELLPQLDCLTKTREGRAWATQVQNVIIDLCHTSPGEPQRLVDLVQQLQTLADAADALADQAKNENTAELIRRVHDGLNRRLLLWSVAFAAPARTVYADMAGGQQQRERLAQAMADVNNRLRTMSFADGWRRYLMLDDISRLTDNDHPVPEEVAIRIARSALAQLQPQQHSEAQRQVLEDPAIKALADQLHAWAAETVDVRSVLASMEQYEATGLPSDAKQFAAGKQSLAFSSVEKDRKLAQQLDEHYRNANVRVAVAGDLLNRLLPDPKPSTGIVNDTIFGASVNGKSETTAQLHVQLVPDPARVHMLFEAEGVVNSQTQATRGPATFTSEGEANFTVRKAVVLDQKGLMTAKALAMANSETQLTGVHTTLDNKPVVGSIARRVATKQQQSMRDEAKQEVNQRVAAQAEQKVNTEVDRRLKQADDQVATQVFGPLAKLDVALEPISFETTPQRFAIRVRLAGQSQLGGHTLRPLAPSDSLMSMQIHESALNNVLDQLQLAGRTFTPAELYAHLTKLLGIHALPTPTDLPTDVSIKFAAADPVRLRCEEGVIRISLAISELQQASRRWNDFEVTATYEPQVDKLHAKLARKGAIELGGENYKGQPEVLLRTVFSRVLPREKQIDLIPTIIADNPEFNDLSVNQCTIEDGWIGLAIGPTRNTTPPSANLPGEALPSVMMR